MAPDADVLLLAGGAEPDLEPLTGLLPPALVPILSEPLLGLVLRRLANQGVRRVVLGVHDFPEQFRQLLATGGGFGIEVELREEPQRLAVGAAVLHHTLTLTGRTLLVAPAHLLHDVDIPRLLQHHERENAGVTLIDHPRHPGLPFFVAERGVFEGMRLPAGAGFPELLEAFRAVGVRPARFVAGGALECITSLAAWKEATLRRVDSLGVWIHPRAVVPEHVRRSATGKIYVGEGAVVEENVQLSGPTVLGDRCHVGRGTLVQRSFVFNRTRVGEGLDVKDAIAAGPMLIDLRDGIGIWMDDPQVLDFHVPEPGNVQLVHAVFDAGIRTVAILLVMLLLPVFALLAVLVKLTSAGPVFQSAWRTTIPTELEQRGRLIRYRRHMPWQSLVFRTTTADGTRTFVGGVLRATRLEQLPLLLTVAAGELDSVGLSASTREEDFGSAPAAAPGGAVRNLYLDAPTSVAAAVRRRAQGLLAFMASLLLARG